MIKCPSCGANLKFKPSTQMLSCDFCRTTIKPEEYKKDATKAREEGKLYKCTSCGGELLSFDETAVTFCSYCGQQTMIESQLIEKNNPDFIIPFQKDQEECIKAYKKYLSKFLFVPSSMKSEITLQKFRGIYMPYALYHFNYEGKINNKGRTFSHRVEDYVYYDQFDIETEVSAEYIGYPFDLLSKFQDRFSEAIPFDYTKAIPYNTNYIAGFYADSLDIDKEKYSLIARTIADADASDKLRKIKEIQEYGCLFPKVPLELKESIVGMFPVYFLSLRDKTGKNIYYAVINGQTGRVIADVPIDFKKYILGSIILTIPIFILMNIYFVFTPMIVLIISMLLGLISFLISLSQIEKIEQKENAYGNETASDTSSYVLFYIKKIFRLLLIAGMIYIYFAVEPFGSKIQLIVLAAIFSLLSPLLLVNKKKNKPALKENLFDKNSKIKFIIKPILGIIIGLIVIVLNLANDFYYYLASLLILGMVLWNFYDIIEEYNLIIKNPPPQLEERGGRENEQ